tara:strand:+ start:947 stop:1048 length:102 start_codon:yes stop_codon:yes gene_type:complete
MTFIERRQFYELLQEEFEKQKEEISKARPSKAR